MELHLDLGAAEVTDLLARQVPGGSDPDGLIHKKGLVVIEDGAGKAEALVGGINKIGRSGGEQRDLAGLEGFQCVLLVAERLDGKFGVGPEHSHGHSLTDIEVENDVVPVRVLSGVLGLFGVDSAGKRSRGADSIECGSRVGGCGGSHPNDQACN